MKIKCLLKTCILGKGYGARKLISEFPDKNWKRSSLDKLLKKMQQMGMVQGKKGSGWPKIARTAQNVSAVEKLALSQKKPTKHPSRDCQRNGHLTIICVPHHSQRPTSEVFEEATRARADRVEPR